MQDLSHMSWLLQRKSFFFPNDCPRPQTHDDWFPDETFDSQPAFLPAMLPFTVQVTSCILHITFSYVLPSSLYLGVRNPTWNYTEPRWLPRTPRGPRLFTINPSFCTWILLLSYVSAAGETHYASFPFLFLFLKGWGRGYCSESCVNDTFFFLWYAASVKTTEYQGCVVFKCPVELLITRNW